MFLQSLTCAIQQLESQLEMEQEKLATLVRNLADVGRQKQAPEEAVSEEWLQSLKERRKVGICKATTWQLLESSGVIDLS